MKITIEIESLEKYDGWYRYAIILPEEEHRSPMTTGQNVISDIAYALNRVLIAPPTNTEAEA